MVEYEKTSAIRSRTYLVGFYGIDNKTNTQDKFYICGYFTLCNMPFEISKDLSNSQKRYLTSGETRRNYLPAILLGQIGKNYDKGLNDLISGSDLMYLAIEEILIVYRTVGLSLVYLDCVNEEKLVTFYKSCGFRLNVDKNGNPIMRGKDNNLLCFVAKVDDLILVRNRMFQSSEEETFAYS